MNKNQQTHSDLVKRRIDRKNEIISQCQSAIDGALKSYSSEDMPAELRRKLEKSSCDCLLGLGI